MMRFVVVCALLGFLAVKTVHSLNAGHRQVVLRSHNRFRRDLANGKVKNKDGTKLPKAKNMYEFKYNLALERLAERSAKKCKFEHSDVKARKFSGETIYTFSLPVNKTIAIDDATAFWWQELKDFGIDDSLNLTRSEFDKGIGHFTQMAWGHTTSIGCAVNYCRNNKSDRTRFTIVFCNYLPAGNILNNAIYEIGKPCKSHSDCTRYKGSKCMFKKGLCRRA
ncbi:Venom allergen-like protein vap-2 [Aphelenchoides bicaudatus]|nr:Venom allergen-like protein vap-2 [Aphelenchoides bicaudatus]